MWYWLAVRTFPLITNPPNQATLFQRGLHWTNWLISCYEFLVRMFLSKWQQKQALKVMGLRSLHFPIIYFLFSTIIADFVPDKWGVFFCKPQIMIRFLSISIWFGPVVLQWYVLLDASLIRPVTFFWKPQIWYNCYLLEFASGLQLSSRG